MPSFASRDIEDEKQNPATGDVPQKIVAEADVAMRAFDQTGNVGNRGAAITVEIDHPNDRMQRGERIRRDLRMRGGNFPSKVDLPALG